MYFCILNPIMPNFSEPSSTDILFEVCNLKNLLSTVVVQCLTLKGLK